VGAITAYRWLRRPPQAAPEPVPAEPDDRAEELRTKLAESRAAEPAVVETPPEPAVEEEPAAEEESPDDRRRQVHEEGRAALDEMQSD
jgi:hypothetical protein